MYTTTFRLYAHYLTMERQLSKLVSMTSLQELVVRPDPLDNQLDLFDSRLNELKAKKWNRDTLKKLHYGNESQEITEGDSSARIRAKKGTQRKGNNSAVNDRP